MSDRHIQELLKELILNIEGLRQEIEGWRMHNASNADFFLHILEDQIKVMKKLHDDYDSRDKH